MHKRLFFTLLAFCSIFSHRPFVEGVTQDIHPCEIAWNNKMQEYDKEYEKGLNNLLFQKIKTSTILDSGAVSYNLRSHNCKMYQICEVVEKSFSPPTKADEMKIIGKFMRCQETNVNELGGYFEECSNKNISNSNYNVEILWELCNSQAKKRISKIETITETEIIKSNSAKTTSNLVKYLMELNEKLDKLAIDIGDMIGLLFDVTRKMTCVQKSCQ